MNDLPHAGDRIRETIPEVMAGERADRVVALLTGLSRAEVADLVDAGAVQVDGSVLTTRSKKLAAGALVEVEVPVAAAGGLVANAAVNLPVVHADDHVIVIDKPAGMVVHPGAGDESDTLAHGLAAHFPEVIDVGEPDRPGIVHRLDKGTSGLLAVARTAAAYESLVGQLAGRSVDRRYIALAWGTVAADSGLIDAPLGRGERDPTRIAVSSGGKEARTRYDVTGRFSRPAPATLLECRLETGRTHQIRVHLAAIGHPVVGDDRYGGARPALVEAPRPFLHAAELAFDHPVSGVRLSYSSPLPDDLVTLLTFFGA